MLSAVRCWLQAKKSLAVYSPETSSRKFYSAIPHSQCFLSVSTIYPPPAWVTQTEWPESSYAAVHLTVVVNIRLIDVVATTLWVSKFTMNSVRTVVEGERTSNLRSSFSAVLLCTVAALTCSATVSWAVYTGGMTCINRRTRGHSTQSGLTHIPRHAYNIIAHMLHMYVYNIVYTHRHTRRSEHLPQVSHIRQCFWPFSSVRHQTHL